MLKFRIAFAMLLFVCLTAQGWADEAIAPAKLKDIQQLMEINGASRISDQYSQMVIAQLNQGLKQSHPDISEKALNVMKKTVTDFISQKVNDKDGLLTKVAALYDKHFTHDEIKGLLAFYSSDLGKKAVRTIPQLATESIRLGQQWGKSVKPELEKRVQDALAKEGVDLNKK